MYFAVQSVFFRSKARIRPSFFYAPHRASSLSPSGNLCFACSTIYELGTAARELVIKQRTTLLIEAIPPLQLIAVFDDLNADAPLVLMPLCLEHKGPSTSLLVSAAPYTDSELEQARRTALIPSALAIGVTVTVARWQKASLWRIRRRVKLSTMMFASGAIRSGSSPQGQLESHCRKQAREHPPRSPPKPGALWF